MRILNGSTANGWSRQFPWVGGIGQFVLSGVLGSATLTLYALNGDGSMVSVATHPTLGAVQFNYGICDRMMILQSGSTGSTNVNADILEMQLGVG